MQQHDVSSRDKTDIAGPRALLAILASTAFLYGCPDGSVDLPETIIPNQDPVANAGPDQTLLASETANLDGGASNDPDGDFFTLEWSFQSIPAGSAAILTDPSAVNPSFVTDVPGDYVVAIALEDSFGGVGTDSVTITAEEPPTRPPVANAGPDREVTLSQQGTTVFLDGTGSSDPDNDPITYMWEIVNFDPLSGVPSQTPVVLIDPDTDSPSFDVTAIDQLGEYTIRLTVDDGTLQDSDEVLINVIKAAPTAQMLLGSGLLVGAFISLRRRRNKRKVA